MWSRVTYHPALLVVVLLVPDAHACTQDVVDACLAPMLQYDLENTATIVPTHDEATMRSICSTYEGVRQCMAPVQDYCHPATRAVWLGIDQSYYYICDQTLDEYVRHLTCLSTPALHVDAEVMCSETYDRQIEGISSHANANDRISLICQYVGTYLTCIHDVVNTYCGEEAATWQRELDLRILGPSLGYIRCPVFEDFFPQWPEYDNSIGSGSSPNIALICAAVAGGLLVLLLIAYVLARWQRRRKMRAVEEEERNMAAAAVPPYVIYDGAMAGSVAFSTAPPPYKEKAALGEDFSARASYSTPPPMYEDVHYDNALKAQEAERQSKAGSVYDSVGFSGESR